LVEDNIRDLDDQPAQDEIGDTGFENASLPQVLEQADVTH
jgi:hypothetical protein